MRLGLISPSLSLLLWLSQLQQHYRYAPRSASSQFHSSSEDSASNIAIQLKHCSNTSGVPEVNFNLFSLRVDQNSEISNYIHQNTERGFGFVFAFKG